MPEDRYYTDKRVSKRTGELLGYKYRKHCKTCVNVLRRSKTTATPYNFIRRSFSQLKSGRLKQGKEWTIEVEDMFVLYNMQEGRCALSGEMMTYQSTGDNSNDSNISLDRIDTTIGYVSSNVQYVCKRINLMRHKTSVKEFITWCERVANKKQ